MRVLDGYRDASPVERGGFGLLTSYGTTIAASRVINYVRERQRHLPLVRSLARRAAHWPRRDDARIHHFFPGMLIATAAGTVGILARDDGRECWLSWPYGLGAALIFDEVALLVDRDNAYWRSEGVALAQGATALAGAGALAVRFATAPKPESPLARTS